jgi:hypothetical protein
VLGERLSRLIERDRATAREFSTVTAKGGSVEAAIPELAHDCGVSMIEEQGLATIHRSDTTKAARSSPRRRTSLSLRCMTGCR